MEGDQLTCATDRSGLGRAVSCGGETTSLRALSAVDWGAIAGLAQGETQPDSQLAIADPSPHGRSCSLAIDFEKV
ncbi:MAG: hypothetical protein EA001_01795 [Oscillatoriales cyanobacterium]|nr:MAG: hypothetical protein EA001_01795 [Oscillatoriales cyanobacterium]